MKKAQEKKTINIKEFDISSIPPSCTIIFIAPPGSGKTTLMEYFAYTNKHKYIGMRAFAGTSQSYKTWCTVSHPLFVTDHYETDEEQKHIDRQKNIEKQNERGYKGNYVINILDDVADDPKTLRSPQLAALFKNGSQHYAQLMMLGTQTCMDVPPTIRENVSYVVIGKFLNPNSFEKIYKNFGGAVDAGNKDLLLSLLKSLDKYQFLVLKFRDPDPNFENNIFWVKSKLLPKWKMGCKEYRDWGEKRYNKDFADDM